VNIAVESASLQVIEVMREIALTWVLQSRNCSRTILQKPRPFWWR